MVQTLQSSGVKVMLMMGGAAHGSYVNLANNVSYNLRNICKVSTLG
jgi:hypothetical protein